MFLKMIGLYLYTLIIVQKILQYVKYTKSINLAKEIAELCDKYGNVVLIAY